MNIPFRSPGSKEGKALADEFGALRVADNPRLSRYLEAERRYTRSRNKAMFHTHEEDDYGVPKQGRSTQLQRHRIPLNFEHAITQKHAFRIAGRPPDIIVPGNDRSALERFRSDTIEKMIYGVQRYSNWEEQLASGGHHASLLGAACFDIWQNPKPYGPQMPLIRELHPGSVLVISGIERVHDYECVYRFWRVQTAALRRKYGQVELPHGSDVTQIQPDEPGGEWSTLVEKTDRDSRTRFVQEIVLEEWYHGYGFVPYVVIPNLGPVETFWGLSDWEFYKDVVAYYEAVISRQADVSRGTAGGAMQDFGSGQNASKVLNIIRNGGLVPVKPKSEGIKPIEQPQFGDWHESHVANIRRAIDDTAFTPDAAWGAPGATTSGSDRALQLGPQLELTGLKQIHWSAGIKRINEMVLRLIEMKTTEPTTFRGATTKGHRSSPFTLVVNAASTEGPDILEEDSGLDTWDPETGKPLTVPQTPREIIDGDYCTEVIWQNRLDRDDPQFVLQELNKFQQGVQSGYTTLERLGVADPDEELKLIQREAKQMPWIRSGMVALLMKQLQADAQAVGGSGSSGGDLSGALDTLTSGSGSEALGADAQGRALNGSSNTRGRTPGSVPGAPYGAA